jgi:hypothetical protein
VAGPQWTSQNSVLAPMAVNHTAAASFGEMKTELRANGFARASTNGNTRSTQYIHFVYFP